MPNQGLPMLDLRSSHDDQIWEILTRDIERLQQIRTTAARFIQKTQQRQRQGKEQTIPPKLSIGDQVLLYRNVVEANWSAKLEPKWEGPFYIAKIKGTSIWLRRPQGTILPTPVHRARIKKYNDRQN
jgi:hypothetical protein